MRKKPKLVDHQVEELAADQRDAEAIARFFRVVLGGHLKQDCRRLGSAQTDRMKGRLYRKGAKFQK